MEGSGSGVAVIAARSINTNTLLVDDHLRINTETASQEDGDGRRDCSLYIQIVRSVNRRYKKSKDKRFLCSRTAGWRA